MEELHVKELKTLNKTKMNKTASSTTKKTASYPLAASSKADFDN